LVSAISYRGQACTPIRRARWYSALCICSSVSHYWPCALISCRRKSDVNFAPSAPNLDSLTASRSYPLYRTNLLSYYLRQGGCVLSGVRLSVYLSATVGKKTTENFIDIYILTTKMQLNFRSHSRLSHEDPKTEKNQQQKSSAVLFIVHHCTSHTPCRCDLQRSGAIYSRRRHCLSLCRSSL